LVNVESVPDTYVEKFTASYPSDKSPVVCLDLPSTSSTTATTMTSPILLPEDTIKRVKNRDATLIRPEQNGTRDISLGLLSPSSSISSRSTSTASSASVATQFISVPTSLESTQTYEFLGLTEDKALELFRSRRERENETGAHIALDRWVIDHVVATCDAQDSEDDWVRSMTEAGIKNEIQHAIMREEHANIRGTQGLSVWLEDIIDTNYMALVDMNARILQELAPSSGVHLRGGAGDEYTVPQTPSGHLVLYKSVEFRRCKGCISEDGSVNLARLESTGPTDFARRGGLYFTNQLWVARHYAALITGACPVADRRTVELHIPLSHLVNMKVWDLRFEDDNFKQLLYFSRRDEKYPKPLSQLRGEHGIISGPIGHVHNLAFGKMSSWNMITAKHQLQEKEKVENNKGKGKEIIKYGKQWVWIKAESVAQLEIDCKDKVYLTLPHQGVKLVAKPWNDKSVKDNGDSTA
jgi:hypothetical protein